MSGYMIPIHEDVLIPVMVTLRMHIKERNERAESLSRTMRTMDGLDVDLSPDLRRMSRTAFSAGSLARMDFCLISVPFGHCDEPEILRYENTPACPIGADVRQMGIARGVSTCV